MGFQAVSSIAKSNGIEVHNPSKRGCAAENQGVIMTVTEDRKEFEKEIVPKLICKIAME
jgi:hypothetical protein